MMIPIGSRVKPSAYVVRKKYDQMTKYTGGPFCRTAEMAYETERDKRGTVTADLSREERGFTVKCFRVQWDNGSISDCLDYMVERAE